MENEVTLEITDSPSRDLLNITKSLIPLLSPLNSSVLTDLKMIAW